MNTESLGELRQLIRAHRLGVLAVSASDEPFTAMVSYVETLNLDGFLIHLSNLSPHKKMLVANLACSLCIIEPDDGRAEPMSLARVTIQAHAEKIQKTARDYVDARDRFISKIPSSEIMFNLPDFDLFLLTPTHARYIAGFGRIHTIDAWQVVVG
jgi:hypothetical protein